MPPNDPPDRRRTGRADRAEAALAAQIEADAGIADLCKRKNEPLSPRGRDPYVQGLSSAGQAIAAAIRAQPHDRTALDRMMAEAREKALREAADLADTSINKGGLARSMAFFLRAEDHATYRKACEDYRKAILALIEKPHDPR